MSSRPIAFLFAATTLSSVVIVACGGAESAPPGAPRSDLGPAPSSVEDAQKQIEAARAELGGSSALPETGAGAGPSADSASKLPSSTTPATPPPPPSTPTSKPATKTEEAPSRNADICQSPCRAIASMRRAVTALCRMTGTDDTRCTDAKKTLADSETKLVPCGC